MPAEVKTLYRPVGLAELELIGASGFREFPPRLPDQPFFYPVVNEDYATQIARDWNTKDANSGFTGYVLRFDVLSSFLDNYEIRTVGGSRHREYWIPAADLSEFNRNLVGLIQVIGSYKAEAPGDATAVFDLGSSGGANIARNKDAMIGESFDNLRRNTRRD